jgi:membrane-associated phospholipid phosphatase
MPESVLAWGIDLILQLQASIGDWAAGPLNFFTFLGYEEWYLLMMPFVFWCVDAGLGLRLAFLLSLSNSVTVAFKLVLHDPRPYWLDPRVRLLTEGEPSFGIPSGHALNGIAIWGALAQAVRKPWAWLAAGLVIFLIGFSRVVLGVHFPTDVLAGWAIGIVLLYLVTKFEAPVVRWYRKLGGLARFGVVFGAALYIIVSGYLISGKVRADFPLPPAWGETAASAGSAEPIDPFDPSTFVTNAGVLFGAVMGFTWLQQRGGFVTAGPWWQRILRFAVGMAVAIAIWAGLDAVFAMLAEDATLLGVILRFIRYALIGIWVAVLAPRTFIRLGWARSARTE